MSTEHLLRRWARPRPGVSRGGGRVSTLCPVLRASGKTPGLRGFQVSKCREWLRHAPLHYPGPFRTRRSGSSVASGLDRISDHNWPGVSTGLTPQAGDTLEGAPCPQATALPRGFSSSDPLPPPAHFENDVLGTLEVLSQEPDPGHWGERPAPAAGPGVERAVVVQSAQEALPRDGPECLTKLGGGV